MIYMTNTPLKTEIWHVLQEMGCPAFGIWVGFLKQPALPDKAPPKKILQKKYLPNSQH
jgi:hypothetical protein